MPQCSVPGCTKQGGHCFPANGKLRKQWVIAIKRDSAGVRGRLWEPGTAARVCSAHFDKNDYVSSNYYG